MHEETKKHIEWFRILDWTWERRIAISTHVVLSLFFLQILEYYNFLSIKSVSPIYQFWLNFLASITLSILIVNFCNKSYLLYKKKSSWKSLTREEREFIAHYINLETKTKYVTTFNGTYQNSGIINPLIHKKILYIASHMTEFRGDSLYTKEQQFPFNIHDDAYKYFKKNLKSKRKKDK